MHWLWKPAEGANCLKSAVLAPVALKSGREKDPLCQITTIAPRWACRQTTFPPTWATIERRLAKSPNSNLARFRSKSAQWPACSPKMPTKGTHVELWQVLILATIQGVTEFLPISSSGHLVIVAALTGVKDNIVEVNIVLHVGTLFSILVFYWHRIWRLINEDRKVIALLIVGTVPAVVIGVTLKASIPEILESPLLAGCMLPFTGIMLVWAASNKQGKTSYDQLTYGQSCLIGLAQAIAILPGISRSGSTISAGLKLGLSPQSAATFSFLLAIPVIGGAGLLEVKDLIGDLDAGGVKTGTDLWLLAVGAVVSFIVGLASLNWLVRLLEKGRLSWFAWWCIPFGVSVIIWQLVTMNMTT